jgi:cytochrome c nitrite reductase small subunit
MLKRLITLAVLPPRFRVPCMALLGCALGLGLVVAHLSRATSYLGNDPTTCVNCHIMGPQYLTWQHSQHANVATCNDCHVPHDNVVHHYAFKAKDGMRHASMFTLRMEPEVIRLSEAAIPVVENNCRRCHERAIGFTQLGVHRDGDRRCWDCHRDVPHGTVRSLSSTPTVLRPQLPDSPTAAPTIGGRAPAGVPDYAE